VKVVGLHIEKGLVAGAVIERGMRSAELVDSFSLAWSTNDELAALLRDKARAWAHSHIVCSIPGRRFSQRLLTFPFSDRKRLEKALPFELEDSIPFSEDDVEIDHLVLGGSAEAGKKEFRVLGMMTTKSSLRQQLDALASAGLDPNAIVPSFIGLCSLAKTIPTDGPALFVSGSDLCLTDGRDIVACRSFSETQPTASLTHTLKAIEVETGIAIGTAYLFSAADKLHTELEDAGISVNVLSPEFNGKKAADAVSLGLALTDQVNFRKGEFAYRLADAGTRKRKLTLIVAGVAVAVLATANIGVRYYFTQSAYTKLDKEIRDTYQKAFPDAKAAADPMRQMRMKIDEAKKKFGALGGGSSALDVMKAVTDGIPKEVRVTFQEFLLEGDRLKLSGDAASFESIDKMKAELAKSDLIADVQVQDSRMGVDNKVKFRFDIKLKQSM
jgi:type II secretory pathway component PulL